MSDPDERGQGDGGDDKQGAEQGNGSQNRQQGDSGQQDQQQGSGGQQQNQQQQQGGGGKQQQQESSGQQQQGGQQGGGGQQQGQQQGNSGQQQGQQQGGGGQQQGSGGKPPSTTEKVLTGISVVVTLLLFGYVAWHAVQQPSGTNPQVEVIETEQLPTGDVLVRVKFVNTGDQGLLSATVEANCTQPPPTVTFSNVPAGGVQQATLVCPPGTENVDVAVSSWIPT